MKACTNSIGRRYQDKTDILIKDNFKNDYTKILNSKAIRRLSFKTQVMCMPDNPHIRTRAVHTYEVISIASSIAENLGLNINLCESISAGHDLGHAPYGHFGEKVISELSGMEFKHEIFSVVIAQHIERPRDKPRGLNLTYETLEGILNHSLGNNELNKENELINKLRLEEYKAVMWADKIAYTLSDLGDAVRYDYLQDDDIPQCAYDLGSDQRERVKNVVTNLIRESKEKETVSYSHGKVYNNFNELRSFMFKNVYFNIDWSIHKTVIERLYKLFSDNKDKINVEPAVAIALLTDREANYASQLLLNSKRLTLNQIKQFGIFEVLPYLKDNKIDFTNPDLDWVKIS